MKTFLLIILFSSQLKAECFNFSPFESDLNDFITTNIKVGKELTHKVMDVEVNLDGSGQINLVLDEAGKLQGIGIYYKDELKGILSVQELKEGKNIEFDAEDKKGLSPLKLSLKPNSVFDPNGSAIFILKVLIHGEPPKYVESEIILKKVGSTWSPLVQNQKVSKIALDPKLGWSGWNGTFKKYQFK